MLLFGLGMALASTGVALMLYFNAGKVIAFPSQRTAQEIGNIVAELLLLLLVGILCKVSVSAGIRRMRRSVIIETNLLDDDLG